MARKLGWIGFSFLSLATAACVPQDKYNALKLDRDRQAEQLATAQTESSTARSERDAYKSQLDALMSANSSQNGLANNLSAQNATLQAQLEEMNRRYADAAKNAGNGMALPQPLNDALSSFAKENPDLVDFDSSRGIVKFKSDVTFTPGSAVVTDKAKDVIARFATILNSAGARDYELMVAGHTDNTPVANPQTKAAGHRDNWYLSAHRAIAVGDVLAAHSVSASRLGVVGYADQRPIASNSTESGKAQNRRVEVLILPTIVHHTVVSSAPGTSAKSAARPKMNKDSAEAESHPGMNK